MVGHQSRAGKANHIRKGKGRVRIFTVADGLADNFFNQNASFYRDGTFYFGCSRGIVTFNSEVVEEKHADISLCITDILVDGRPLGTDVG